MGGDRWKVAGVLLSVACVFGVAGTARAAPKAPEPAPAAPTADAPEEAPEEAPDEEDGPRIEVSGRLFARATADQRQDWGRELSLPQARVQVEAGFGFGEAVLEADIASRGLIKDAYLRLNDPSKIARLYVGQFKAPFLSRALISRWDLALVSRGLVADYLTDAHELGGRRLGAMAEVKLEALRDLRISLGAFEGAQDDAGIRGGEDASARVEFDPVEALEVGVSGYAQDALGVGGALALSADATLELFGARLALEGAAGRLREGRFTAGLALVSYAVRVDESWAVEPLLGAEVLALHGERPGRGQAAVLGANLHFRERVKLQVQAERGLFPGDTSMQNRLTAQLGARF